jgi:hypothetical protein
VILQATSSTPGPPRSTSRLSVPVVPPDVESLEHPAMTIAAARLHRIQFISR